MFPPFINRQNVLLMGVPVVNEHAVLSFQPPFILKTSFGEKNAEGRLENGLGSVTEMGVKGYPFIISRRLFARFD